jgi:hypothetical protein
LYVSLRLVHPITYQDLDNVTYLLHRRQDDTSPGTPTSS